MDKPVPQDAPPLLIVISGPSGVGKDSVLDGMRRLPRPWHFIVTATTRPRRANERDGLAHVFMEPSEFQALLEQDGFLEHAEVYGRHYGVPRAQAEEGLSSGKDVIVRTDLQGARTLRAKVPGAILVFLAPPDMAELERRLRDRKSETADDLARRIEAAALEMQCQSEFDYVVVNHSGRLDETIVAIEEAIATEKRKRSGG